MAGYLRKSEGVEVSRRRMVFNAHDTSYSSTARQTIRFEMNISDEHIDMDTVYLVGDIAAASTGATAINYNRYAASTWIKEMRVKSRAGAQIGETLSYYNAARRVEYELMNTTDQEASFDAVMEMAAPASVGAAAYPAKQFAHKLKDHIFGIDKYYPAKYHSGLIVEMDMEDPEKVIIRTGGNDNSYTLSNLRIVCDLVQLRPEIEQALLEQLQQGGLTVHYSTKHVSNSRITTGTLQRFDLGTVLGRVKDIQAFQVLDGLGVGADKWGTMPVNELSHYRFQLGSRYLTESEVRVSSTEQAEYLMEWMKSQGLTYLPKGLYGKAALTPSALLDTKFVIGQKAELSKSGEVLSSIKDKDQNKITLTTKYSVAPGEGTLYVVVNLDKELKLLPGRQFVETDFNQ